MPIPVPRGLRRRSAVVRLLGLWVRFPPRDCKSVSCEYCLLSFWVLCDGLIFIQRRPTKCCVSECDRKASTMRTLAHWVFLRHDIKKYNNCNRQRLYPSTIFTWPICLDSQDGKSVLWSRNLICYYLLPKFSFIKQLSSFLLVWTAPTSGVVSVLMCLR